MAHPALAIPGQVLKDATTNAYDATKMSGGEAIAIGLTVGSGLILAPHLLAIYGALAIMGSAGRARSGYHHLSGLMPPDEQPLIIGSEQTIDEFINDPASQ